MKTINYHHQPRITNCVEDGDTKKFTLSGVNVSVVNAIRRTIISEISCVVFKPKNTNFITNTTKMTNEILKHRLSCIPVHITDINNTPITDYLLEVKKENTTESVLLITTGDFKIKDKRTNKYVSDEIVKKIFKPFVSPFTNEEYYIDFVSLNPKITENISGEQIHFTSEFDLGTAKEDGCYSVASTCSFSNTIDIEEIKKQEEIQRNNLKSSGNMTDEEIEDFINNWRLLEALRFYKKDSFDFVIETIGVFSNEELLVKSCLVVLEKFKNLQDVIQSDNIKIVSSINTMNNCFDIILEGEDYTVGNLLQFYLFKNFYDVETTEAKKLMFCGFVKEHPHNTYSVIRLSYIENTDKEQIRNNLLTAIEQIMDVFEKLIPMFSNEEECSLKKQQEDFQKIDTQGEMQTITTLKEKKERKTRTAKKA